MGNLDIAAQAVDVLEINGGDRNRRPVHTNGVGVLGHFIASDVAKNYCVAEHFQGQRVPVTGRFSNGSGLTSLHDGWSDVRGLAVRFHLGEGRAADLLAMTLSEFFTPTPETFLSFGETTKPAPVSAESAWNKFLDMLALKPPMPDPYPGQTESPNPGAIKFADLHAYSELSVFHAATIGAPTSYARAAYNAVHTFVVEAPDGAQRWVRFGWLPIAGVRNNDPKDPYPPNDIYLENELRARIVLEPVRFLLLMWIGEVGDNFEDPSRPWPPHRVRIIMGTLTIDEVPDTQSEEGERLSFNPWRLVPGVRPSDDPILALRRDAYEISRKRRGGIGCPFAGSHPDGE